MDDRITRIERLAALHRDGALTDDEFRDEKLRVLSGQATAPPVEEARPAPPPAEPPPPPPPPPPPFGPTPVVVEEEAIEDPAPTLDPYEPSAPRPSRAGWWIGGLLVLAAAIVAAVWYARSITLADAPRSSVGTAASRQLASPAPPVPEPVVEEEPTDLSDALAFSDPGQCEFGGEGDRAFGALLSRQDGEWGTDGPVRLGALTLTPKLEVKRSTGDDGMESTSYYATARAPEGVLWNGLKLSRLVHSLNLPAETDPLEERSITFLEDPERVGRVLRDLGVSVPVGAGYRELEDGACGGSMQIKAIPGGSALVCQWGC